MVVKKNDLLNLNYVPSRDDVIAEFYVEPNGITFEDAARNVAGESSIGTWTKVSTMKPRILRDLKPNVFYSNKTRRIIKIAYPLDLFELGSVPQMMSSIAGNIFGMKIVKNLRLLDIHFPDRYIRSFRGPKYGILGVRKKIHVK
ncbi:MAG: ribulose-bisphosphate carboxylase large subunit, partial [Candidatus Aenigmarchaeota archaeon]|nr:ribulose-bisphosphate carboxylase large subunit [Candidatus Aenigmarchaeota archaeon]